jgi:dihydropteroate synthase
MVEITSSLKTSIELAKNLGVPQENIIIDPGIGFGKTWQQDLEIIQRLGELRELGRPILVGSSRKSLIGRVLELPVDDRLEGTAATVAIAVAHGADIVRVHDVRQMVRVCRMSDAVVRRGQGGN